MSEPRKSRSPVIAAALILVLSASLTYGIYLSSSEPVAREFIIDAKISEQGGFQPRIIEVKKGEVVRLVIRTLDVPHGLAILKYDMNFYPVVPGKPLIITFVADKPGEFEIVCTVYCSPRHYEMHGTLRVIG